MSVHLTPADLTALANGNDAYLNQKGAKFYNAQNYESAIEYYRLAASMGNDDSLSNLGYCYLYARSIPQNVDLALAYFRLAGQRNQADALYKLGSIYRHGAQSVEPDPELALYYFQRAEAVLIARNADPLDYPSLLFELAKEQMPGGLLPCDLTQAWQYLLTAQNGYELELKNGVTYHQSALERVRELLKDPCFDFLRQQNESI